MGTLGYAVIILGALIVRQVVTGRAKETPSDLRDLFVGVLHGDYAAISAVASQRGSNVDTESAGVTGSASTSPADIGADIGAGVSAFGATPLETMMKHLGTGKPYVFGATGPNSYDCSGLAWAALRELGLYNGPRFLANGTFVSACHSFITKVPEQERGAMVLWSGHHMGVCDGDDSMFSARSTAKGIGESTISGDSSYFGFAPDYYRINYG